MEHTHLGWEDTKDDVLCHGGDTGSKGLDDVSVYRGTNASVLASSFSEASLDMDMKDEDGSGDVN